MSRYTSDQGDPTSSPILMNLDNMVAQARKHHERLSGDRAVYGPRNGGQVADWILQTLKEAGYPAGVCQRVSDDVYGMFNEAGSTLFAASRALDELTTFLDKVNKMVKSGPAR
jgi:hypothetical protein